MGPFRQSRGNRWLLSHYAAEGLISTEEMAIYRRSIDAPGYPYE